MSKLTTLTGTSNRKPRYRTAVKDWLRATEQETFIRAYRESGWVTACAAIQRTDADIRHWIAKEKERNNGHSPFLEKIGQAKKLRAALLAEQKDDLTPVAVSVMEKTMADAEDKKLRFEAARTHLKGVGFYTEGQKVEGIAPSQDNRRFIINVLTGGDEAARQACRTLLRTLEAGAGGDGGEVVSGTVAESQASRLPEP